MPARGKQIKVEIAEQRREAVGILGFVPPSLPLNSQPVRLVGTDPAAPEPVGMDPRQPAQRQPARAADDLNRVRVRLEAAHDETAIGDAMRTQQRERVAVAGGDEACDGAAVGLGTGV